MGEGEWKVKIHSKSKRRQWIKLHIAIDERTQEIVGQVSSEAYASDSKLAKPLIEQVKGPIKKVLADGAYDTRNLRDFLEKQGIEGLIIQHSPSFSSFCKVEQASIGETSSEVKHCRLFYSPISNTYVLFFSTQTTLEVCQQFP